MDLIKTSTIIDKFQLEYSTHRKAESARHLEEVKSLKKFIKWFTSHSVESDKSVFLSARLKVKENTFAAIIKLYFFNGSFPSDIIIRPFNTYMDVGAGPGKDLTLKPYEWI